MRAAWHWVVEKWLMLWIDIYDAVQTAADNIEVWARDRRRTVRNKWLEH